VKSARDSFPWIFLLLGFTLSWAAWIPIALTGKDYQSSPCLLIGVLVGAFGPSLAAIILNYLDRGKADFNDFRMRIYDIRRIRPSWVLIILAIWPALHGLAIAITHLAGSPVPESAFLQEMIAQPNTVPLVIFMYFLQAGLEEVGWRGYLQEKLGRIYPLAGSAVLVGVIQTIWNLPLFWVVGTNQIQMGFGIDFLGFFLFVVSSAVYSAWCYYGNNHSVFAVALLQTTGNLSFDIFAYAPGTLKHTVFVLLMAAGAVLLLWRLRRFSRLEPLPEQLSID
jgi:membrane protease YdiL (CAAX protease family)